MKTPSPADQERAIAFLEAAATRSEGNNPRLSIYRVLLHAPEAFSSQEITNQLPFNTTSNNTSSKLNHLRRCGLVEVVKTKKSDTTNRQVDCWVVTDKVPEVLEFSQAHSWFLAINNQSDAVEHAARTTETERKTIIEAFAHCRVLRVVEAD
jgi:hypothetical protein